MSTNNDIKDRKSAEFKDELRRMDMLKAMHTLEEKQKEEEKKKEIDKELFSSIKEKTDKCIEEQDVKKRNEIERKFREKYKSLENKSKKKTKNKEDNRIAGTSFKELLNSEKFKESFENNSNELKEEDEGR